MQSREHSGEKKDNGLLIQAAKQRQEGRQSATPLLCRPTTAFMAKAGTLAIMLNQCFPNGLNDTWSTDCSNSQFNLKQLLPL